MTIASVQGEAGFAIVANEENFDPNDNSNFGISYFEYNNKIIGALEVQLERISETELEISYYSLDSDDVIKLKLNVEDQTVTAYSNNPELLKNAGEIEGWGKNTLECINDVYTNHGALSIQSAYIPATAAAFAVVCGIKNL
ncbi:MAG TPA: hypothetical protein VK179_01215 [Bacteroidales bacterium]|nr:hypothetical protein [Bacteroidales bacterium]